MATIKAYTDLSQSKVLAKILPLESADMCYKAGNETQPTFKLHSYGHIMSNNDVYAWSLAALLDVLPPIEGFRPIIDLDINLIRYEGNYHDKLCFYDDNPVDACVAMIIKLHELKML